MTTRTGITLLIVGAILLCAVHLHIGFLSLQVAGAILVVVAALGWWLPRYRPGWMTSQVTGLREWLDPDPDVAGSHRVPLGDIMADPGPYPGPYSGPDLEHVSDAARAPASAGQDDSGHDYVPQHDLARQHVSGRPARRRESGAGLRT